MPDESAFPTSGVHGRLARLVRTLPDLRGRVVLDIPCGDGRASHEFRARGAEVIALDLFPEFMRAEGVEARRADLTEPLPVGDGAVDYVVCQEGIEHVPDALRVLREFNRVLRPGGTLILTTPSDSHLRARLTRLLTESDHWRRMPPSEIDAVWFADGADDRIYFGHLFLLGVQKLETLLRLAGFGVQRRLATGISGSSVALGLPLYPLLALATGLSWFTYRRKNRHLPQRLRDQVLRQRAALNLSPKTLFCKHIFWVARKERELDEVAAWLRGLGRETT